MNACYKSFLLALQKIPVHATFPLMQKCQI